MGAAMPADWQEEHLSDDIDYDDTDEEDGYQAPHSLIDLIHRIRDGALEDLDITRVQHEFWTSAYSRYVEELYELIRDSPTTIRKVTLGMMEPYSGTNYGRRVVYGLLGALATLPNLETVIVNWKLDYSYPLFTIVELLKLVGHTIKRVEMRVDELQRFEQTHGFDDYLRQSIEDLSVIMQGNRSIESLCICVDSSGFDRDIFFGLCSAFSALQSLKELHLAVMDSYEDDAVERISTLEETQILCNLIGLKSMRKLRMINIECNETVVHYLYRCIATSSIEDLTVVVYTDQQAVNVQQIPVALLGNSTLRKLTLEMANFDSLDTSLAFVQAIGTSNITDLRLEQVAFHLDSLEYFVRAVCRSKLRVFDFSMGMDDGKEIIVQAFIRNLSEGSPMEVFRLEYSLGLSIFEIADISGLVIALSNCRNLVRLKLPSHVPWNNEMDEALAHCLRCCRSLCEIELYTRISDESIRAGRTANPAELYTAPALLAAARYHASIETVSLEPDRLWHRPDILEMNRICQRNKEVKLARPRLAVVLQEESDFFRAGLIGKTVFRVRDKPHLVYLTLTISKSIFV